MDYFLPALQESSAPRISQLPLQVTHKASLAREELLTPKHLALELQLESGNVRRRIWMQL